MYNLYYLEEIQFSVFWVKFIILLVDLQTISMEEFNKYVKKIDVNALACRASRQNIPIREKLIEN